jgi:hypothetical protein
VFELLRQFYLCLINRPRKHREFDRPIVAHVKWKGCALVPDESPVCRVCAGTQVRKTRSDCFRKISNDDLSVFQKAHDLSSDPAGLAEHVCANGIGVSSRQYRRLDDVLEKIIRSGPRHRSERANGADYETYWFV